MIFFKEKINETTFLNDKDGDLQILSSKEQTNHHALDQTCITFVIIPRDSSSKVTLDLQPFHLTSSFQFPKKKCGNQKRSAKLTSFKSFSGCIMALG